MTSATLPPSAAGAPKKPASRSEAARPAPERELREPEQADSDHLPGEHVARPDCREDDLDDAVVLLLDHARDDPLAVDRERGEQEQRADVRDERLGIGRLRARPVERRGRQLRRRRQPMP
jgi:hypothetical protein